MPDWNAYVRAHLSMTGLRPDREQDVVDDIAGQLEEVYREGIGRGLSEPEAEAAAVAHIPDWTSLATEVAGSKRLAERSLDRIERRASDAGAAGNRRAEFLGGVLNDVRYALRM